MHTNQPTLAAAARPVATNTYAAGARSRSGAITAAAIACVSLLLTACTDDAEPGSDPCEVLAADLDAALAATLADTTRSGGTAAAVITPECGLWEGAVGSAGDDEPLTADHLLRVGSVTKTFVAATTLSLVADGALELDATIDTWAPDIPNAEQITIRQLLNHTSGIYNYTDDEAFLLGALGDPTVEYTPQQLVDVSRAHEPLFEPGADWHYSNTNYIVLGMIIESVTGNPAAVEIRARLLDPQSLTNTFLVDDEALVGTLADGFGPDGAVLTDALNSTAAWTAGAMVSTAGDLASWASELYGGRVLAPLHLDDMLRFVATQGVGFSYGLGVMSMDASVAETELVGHGGAIPGYRAEMFYLPALDSSVVTIVNSEAGDSSAALAALVDEVMSH
ncbi:MAG: hypothetical protein Tsb0020_44840 [Haliangiales bacterium]